MSDLPSLLLASLSPETRKQAEQSLGEFSVQPSFLPHLLGLVLDGAQNKGVRLAGSVFFKNVIKKRWSEVRVFVLGMARPYIRVSFHAFVSG